MTEVISSNEHQIHVPNGSQLSLSTSRVSKWHQVSLWTSYQIPPPFLAPRITGHNESIPCSLHGNLVSSYCLSSQFANSWKMKIGQWPRYWCRYWGHTNQILKWPSRSVNFISLVISCIGLHNVGNGCQCRWQFASVGKPANHLNWLANQYCITNLMQTCAFSFLKIENPF